MTATPTPVTVSSGTIRQKTSQRFSELRARARRGIFTEALAVSFVALCLFALFSFVIDRNLRLETPVRAVLLVGFAYVWKRGDLDWVRAVSAERAAAGPRGP